MKKKGTEEEGYKDMISTAEQEKVVPPQMVVPRQGRRGRLWRFLFAPPPLGPIPPPWGASELAGVAVINRFAARLAQSPPDLVTHLGMVRSNAYYAAGCPLELCDHAAARDIWNVIYQDAITKEALCQ